MGLPRKSKIISFLLIISMCMYSVGSFSFAESDKNKIVTICGMPIGLMLNGDGITVTGYMTNDGKKTGLKIGDRIMSIDGKKVTSGEELQSELNNKKNDCVILSVIDCNTQQNKTLSVTPTYDAVNNGYRLGVWVKDSTAGIGTMTFYDNTTKEFASLGHGITENGELYQISGGTLQEVTIFDIEKSVPGRPGELKGYFNDVNNRTGDVDLNTEQGIYGHIESNINLNNDCYEIEVAKHEEAHTGEAYIVTSLGENCLCNYKIRITSINKNQNNGTKALSICVIDNRLIEKTGGIVQGMSGSPIVQDGKLIGAVTHVLIDDPTSGYGIFAEDMLELARSITLTENNINDVA